MDSLRSYWRLSYCSVPPGLRLPIPPEVTLNPYFNPSLGTPPAVWTDDPFTVVAGGSYVLDEDTEELVENEEAEVTEEYIWKVFPAVCDTYPADSAQETFHYLPPQWGTNQSLDLEYIVTVTYDTGEVEVGSMSTTINLTDQKLVVSIVLPAVSPFEAAAEEEIDFAAQALVLPGETHVTAQCGWEWDFGDGSAADTANPTTHVYAEAGVYDVIVTGSIAGQEAEAKAIVAQAGAPPPAGGASLALIDPNGAGVASDLSFVRLTLGANTHWYQILRRPRTTPASQWEVVAEPPPYPFYGPPEDVLWATPEQNGEWEWKAICWYWEGHWQGWPYPGDPPGLYETPVKVWRVENTVVSQPSDVTGVSPVIKYDPEDTTSCQVPWRLDHAVPAPTEAGLYWDPFNTQQWRMEIEIGPGLASSARDPWDWGMYPELLEPAIPLAGN